MTKLNAAGNALVYSTLLGGSADDLARDILADIAVDAQGNAYVTSGTESADFPTTPGAFDTTYGGQTDVFVTKLNAAGSGLVYSTYLGGSGSADGKGIAVDAAGNAYITGRNKLDNFPITPGAFGSNVSGDGGAFVTKLNATGTSLIYSAKLSGISDDIGNGIAIDAQGNAYVTGITSGLIPTTPGAFDRTFNESNGIGRDAFVTKLNATGSSLVYSTFLGSPGLDDGRDIALDAQGNAYVTGTTEFIDFPTTPDAFDQTFNGLEDAAMPQHSEERLGLSGTGLLNSFS